MDVLTPALDERARDELARAADAYRNRVERLERDSAARGDGLTTEATVMLMTFAAVTPEAG